MGRAKKHGNLTIKDGDRDILEKMAKSQTAEYRKVQRAKILLMSADGMSNVAISSALGVHRNTVATFITKYIAGGLEYAINDSARTGKPNRITDDEKAWITNLACTKPKELGYAAELWTYRALRNHVQKNCVNAGYPELENISHNTVRTILGSNEIKPNKITYYLEKKDPDFESKMHDVLLVYKQVEMCFDQNGNLMIPMEEPKTITVSYDEKPGIQALENIAPDLAPKKGHGKVARDYEYKRLGTLSLLAGMDLLTGEIIPLVSDTHKSSDFIEWLAKLDAKYPQQDTLRPYLKRLSNATVSTIKFSITLSMCINFLAVTLSVLGVLTPTTGALVHNAGSCFVVLIAALLYDRKFEN